MIEQIMFWNHWWQNKSLHEIKERKIHEKISVLFKRKEVLFLSGVRRSGKTSIMYHLIKQLLQNTSKENILYLNLDDAVLRKQSLDEIFLEYQKFFPEVFGKIYIFLDEVQNIDGWERWVKKMYDSGEDLKIVVTGSKANLLKKNSTLLTGRMLELSVYPLEFIDFLAFKNFEVDKMKLISQRPKLLRLYDEFLKYGGFPEVVLEKDKDIKILLLKEYYDNIKNKDIVMYFNIRESKKFDNMSLFLISNISKTFSSSKIGKMVHLSTQVVENYLNFSEMMYFFLPLNHFDYSIKAQITKPRKIYSVDTGFPYAVSFKFSENQGRLIENQVFIELKRRGFEVYYYTNKHECDFVVKTENKIREVIQVCYTLDEDNKKREIDGLLMALKEFGLQEGTILTFDKEEKIIVQNKTITIKPVWKWLLEK